jgi:phenylalanyl-tRNA synthetase beta chain
MKISLNKLRFAGEHYDVPNLVPDGLDTLVEKIGTQLGAVEEVTQYGDRFDGVVIVKVASCEKHPNADKLQVCLIDDGGVVKGVKRDSNGLVQVVCGAPNVHKDMLAAWLPPGATVPATRDKEPFVLEARELRGIISNGMLASPKELGLGDSHHGLLEVDVDAKPGTTFTKAYRAEGEAVIDIENKMFTHRPDCFGLLGVAREIAGIQGLPFKSPDWYTPNPTFPAVEAEELKLKVTNELPKLVPRFTAITLRDVTVEPSPVWLQIVLTELGIRPINNIVDYTNFWMLETGQPLHAYDYDKVKALSGGEAAHIVLRQPKKGEKIKLLNGKTIEPREEAIMIATDKQLIGIGGVMGGTETEVDASTKNIILECANFDMYSIRRTSMAHGLFTDAVTRFTKGQSPLQNPAVLAIITEEIRHYAGGKVAGKPIDSNHVDKTVLERGSLHKAVATSVDFINSRLGLELSAAEIKKLLENVEFTVKTDGDKLTVKAPFWRTDIEIPEDVVEEVGRLYGYDKLPLKLPQRDLTPAQRDPLLDLKHEIRARLSKAGVNEVLTYSFVHGNLLDRVGQNRAKAFEIANALSPDLQYYRISLMPSLLEKIHPNIKAGYDEFALFEIGKGHSLDDKQADGLPAEFEFTALVVTANDKLKKPGAAYYQARAYLEAVTGVELTFKPVSKDMQQYPVTKPYDMNRSALVSIKNGDFLGIIGEFRPGVIRALKLPKFTAGFEIDTTVLKQTSSGYQPLSRFPGVKQDITLKVAADLPYEDLYDFINKELAIQAPNNTQLESIDIYQKKDDAKHKQLTFRITVTDPQRTLTDKAVTAMLDKIAASAKTKFKAERI